MQTGIKSIIRVLIVDDSTVMCKILTDILNSDTQILVVGVAHNGKEAVDLVPKLKPDIITMDIHMPVMDGFEATKHIMAFNPTPILVVSSSVFKAGMNTVFMALSYGALEVLDKGTLEVIGDVPNKKCAEELIEKIKFLSKIKVITHPLGTFQKEKTDVKVPVKEDLSKLSRSGRLNRIIGIVSSTGGPPALLKILKGLPREFPCSIVIVQHISSGFAEGLADWLNDECEIEVKIAKNLEEIQPGIAYLAPTDLQMRVGHDNKIHLTKEPPYNGFNPSGDLLLTSVAESYGERAVGIILTGMGRDGSEGIQSVKLMRGKTIAQNEATSVIFSMPKSAIDLGVIDEVLPLENITDGIVKMLGST